MLAEKGELVKPKKATKIPMKNGKLARTKDDDEGCGRAYVKYHDIGPISQYFQYHDNAPKRMRKKYYLQVPRNIQLFSPENKFLPFSLLGKP